MFGRRRKIGIETERLTLRLPVHGDWQAWARLRDESRGFVAPWEPAWAPDHLSRKAFTNRVYWAARADSSSPIAAAKSKSHVTITRRARE